MADIQLNLLLSIEKATQDVAKFTNQAVKSFDKVSDSIGELEKNTSIASQTFSNFTANILAKGAIEAFNIASGAAKTFFNTMVVDGIKAFQEEEDAINRLNSALRAHGLLSKENSDALLAQASALQATTKFADDQVISVQALLANLTSLSSDGIQTATKATLDLSTAMSIDLESAARLVGKAAEGNVSALKKYGIEVKAGVTDSETFANTLKLLQDRFGGASEAAQKTFSGALANVGNTFGDLQETFGSLVAQNPVVIEALNALSKLFQFVKQTVEENRASLSDFIGDMVALASNVIPIVINGFDFIQTALSNIGGAFNFVSSEISKFIARFIQTNEAAYQSIKDTAEKEELARQNSLASRQEFLAKVEEFAARQVDKIQETADKEIEIDAVKYQTKNDMALLQQEQKAIQDEEDALKRDESAAKEIEALIAKNEALKIINTTYANEEIARNKALIDQKLVNIREGTDQEIKTRAKVIDMERRQTQERLQLTSSFFGNLATLSRTGNKELFEIGRAAALAQAVVDGSAAFIKALAAAPPPFNFALAASVAVATGVQIATISAQKLATGITEVPRGFSNDTFPAMLTSGERVISAPQNEDLKSFIDESRGDVGILASIDQKISAALGRPVVVQISGREIFRTVDDELLSGRVFSTA